jgi:DNA repair protein RadD
MNIFERLPIFRLVELIGADQLSEVEGVLEALNRSDLNIDLVNTKGFLSKYAKQVIGFKHLHSKDGAKEIFTTLSDVECSELLMLLGSKNPLISKQDAISFFIEQLKNKSKKVIIGDFLGFAHLDIDLEVEVDAPSKLSIPAAAYPYKPLKDYQFEVLFKAASKLKITDSRFILQMPTGSGKTRTAMEIVSDYLNQYPDGSVIWLAHSTELCDQASECFLEVWPHLAKNKLLFQRHYGVHKIPKYSSEKIGFLCSSFQSLLTIVDKNPEFLDSILSNKRLIVVDEAHKVVAPTYKRVTRGLIKNGSAVMGLTATPGRSYGGQTDNDENEELAKFFFDSQISFTAPNDQDPIEYLRSKKVLASAKLEALAISGVDIALTSKELDYIAREFELPKEVLVRLGTNHLRNAEILSRLINLVNDGEAKSIIFFATSLGQSKLISSLLNFLSIKSEHVDGETPRLARQEITSNFRAQKIQVLCNYEVLSTGFDAPLVDCVFIARPTASVVLYSQMIGRGLRGPAIGGKEKCLIINVKDNFTNLPSIEAMYSIFDDYWVN